MDNLASKSETISSRTRKSIESWCDTFAGSLAPDSYVVIAGKSSYSQYVYRSLKKHTSAVKGFYQVTWSDTSQDIEDTLSFDELTTNATDIVSGSMSRYKEQELFFTENAPDVRFHHIPNSESFIDPDVCESDYLNFSRYKNKHLGKDFLIIGNGPSLNTTPPEALEGYIKMGANGFCMYKNMSPDYYFALDRFAVDYWHDIWAGLECEILLSVILKEHLNDDVKAQFFPACFALPDDSFSPIKTGIPTGSTVVSSMLYTALYMGAKRVFILGVDNNYKGQKHVKYFTSEYHGKHKILLSEEKANYLESRQTLGIQSAIDFLEKNGVSVFDASNSNNQLNARKIKYSSLL